MSPSRASSSASEGEVLDKPHKANSANQNIEAEINGSNRVFGLDGASDDYGYKYRPLSRSPSPYRRKPARSPSPYRNRRAVDRSPSPFRHAGRSDRGQPYHKRKASPLHGSRPEKRFQPDRSRNGRSHRTVYPDAPLGPARPRPSDEHSDAHGRSSITPLSYAELDNPKAVPDFRDGLPINEPLQNRSDRGHQRDTRVAAHHHNQTARNGAQMQDKHTNEHRDHKMSGTAHELAAASAEKSKGSLAVDATDYELVPVEEKIPTEESREEKRRRWAAKRAAVAEQANNGHTLLQQAILTNASEATTSNAASPAVYAESSISPFPSPRNGDLNSAPASPDVMIVDKQSVKSEGNSPAADSPSAADYDPMQDMLDDRERAANRTNQRNELSSDAYQETDPRVLSTLPAQKIAPVKEQEKEFDMFNFDNVDEDEDVDIPVQETIVTKGNVLNQKMLGNWDDPEGYYNLIPKELVNNGRYLMIRALGRGVFANVAQAQDTTIETEESSRKLVAIKMIRRNDVMRKASLKEIEYLRRANEADPQDKRHVIKLLGSFDHKGHLCIVFEHMSKNLRDLLKEETNGHGLALPAVRIYGRQIFSGLQHLLNHHIIHLDLKPDNILVSADKKIVKLADFGTAVDDRDPFERSEYLVSRFYRAPEIIFGMAIRFPVDVWAIGCTIYELWTGKILFTGRSNNHMVKSFIDCLGWPSPKLLRKGNELLVRTHFDPDGASLKYLSHEVGPNNTHYIRKIDQQKKIHRDLKTRVHDAARGIAHDKPNPSELNELADLLGACLLMNVEKRISPKDALNHHFFSSKNNVSIPMARHPLPLSAKPVVKPNIVKRGLPGVRR